MDFVNSLKANMLVENDIIIPKGIIIDLANSTIFLTSCNIWIAITAKQKSQLLRKKPIANTTAFLSFNCRSLVLVIYGALLGNHNFFFQQVQ